MKGNSPIQQNGLFGPFQSVQRPDGTRIAFDILGAELQDGSRAKTPVVFVGGMTSCRHDFDRVAVLLARSRPVLLVDHRGMGDSTIPPDGVDKFTIEVLARDLLAVLETVGWKKIAIISHSMGGIVAQQLLFLPYHPTQPTPLPFTVSHVVFAASLPRPIRNEKFGVKFPPKPLSKLTQEQRAFLVRASMYADFDDAFWDDPANEKRIDELVARGLKGRPFPVIFQQRRSTSNFDFTSANLHARIPRSTRVLAFSGAADQIVPPTNQGDFLALIPHARALRVSVPGEGGELEWRGQRVRRGTVPSATFGHNWVEYFTPEIWLGVFEEFFDEGEVGAGKSKL
ncbi:alpha beta-hydrolase [Coniophora puteana RWD-64-598 SS2]|uniref:Alpha beta-hydrolase n=1 Tax=Coniophora puteana (strain RWD-64-598) TaxID=741705 RepID=A0A5M3MNI0_CONPW|nr:alpha beta-hydrolase [Coniophora puteana RWD-64-598 SS2]EIW80181.1 alpha beta-hydrolase [Coniophora puteana RWD-64-598 SS2]